MTLRALHLYCGGGGFVLGTQRAGFETVGAFDNDPRAIAAHDYLTGGRATAATKDPTVATIGAVTSTDEFEVDVSAGALVAGREREARP